MKNIIFVFVFVMAFSLMTIIDADDIKQRSKNLFRERLLDLLMEAKRRELILNKLNESEEDLKTRETNRFYQESEEDNYPRTYLRRKVVGISDNPF